LPGISIASASDRLQEQDQILKYFPEVETVFGTIGRCNSATDNAPLGMYDTTGMLKPRDQWRAGMTYDLLISFLPEFRIMGLLLICLTVRKFRADKDREEERQ